MIWCVEDDASIRDIEVYALQSTGFEARGFADGDIVLGRPAKGNAARAGRAGRDAARHGRHRAAAPHAARRARFAAIPVVMATAKGAEYDKIQGLDLGADYYLAKPFGVMELVSCVKAVLRRCQPQAAQSTLLQTGGAHGRSRRAHRHGGRRSAWS